MNISFNSAATAALAVLRHNDSTHAKMQDVITTGMRISEAADNAAYWSIATDMRNTTKATSTVIDALELGAALVDVSYQGMEDLISITSEIKTKIMAIKEPGVDRYKVSSEIYELEKQFLSTTQSSSFNGRNLLAPGDLHYTEKSYVDGNGKTLNYIEMSPPDTNVAFGGIVASYTKGKVGIINIYGDSNLNVFGPATYKNADGSTLGAERPGRHATGRRHDRRRAASGSGQDHRLAYRPSTAAPRSAWAPTICSAPRIWGKCPTISSKPPPICC